jgi:phosphonate transport system permease protein
MKLLVEGASFDVAPAAAPTARHVWRITFAAVAFALLFAQALVVVKARPQDLITGIGGMADILRRSLPPNFGLVRSVAWPTLETFDTALFGTIVAMFIALPLAIFAARNVTPSRVLYAAARGTIALTRAVPDLIWALLFVTAVGLGPFPGALALAVHSIGMLGRLFAEVIEDMDMGPVEALTLTGASRLQVFTHAVVPGVAPSLLGIALYRLDENVRSSLVLGFVGAGGVGFQILTAMNLFQYRDVSLYLLLTFALVVAVERVSAAVRRVIL